MAIKNKIWDSIEAGFRQGMSSSEFDTWFSQASPKKINHKTVIIQVPNKFIATWLMDRYGKTIHTYLKKRLEIVPEIRFVSSTAPQFPKDTSYDQYLQFLKPLNPLNTFSSFVTAKSNRLAYSSALEVADGSSTGYNPFFIFSGHGFGKTHLLNAIGNMAVMNNPSAEVTYFSTEAYVRDFLASESRNADDIFFQKCSTSNYILIDDLHLIGGYQNAQEQLLALLGKVLQSDIQLVVAAPLPPNKMKGLLPELRSRLEWGLITEIHPPTLKIKTKLIKLSAELRGLTLDDGVVDHLAKSTDNLKQLQLYMDELEQYARVRGVEIDLITLATLIDETKSPPSSMDLSQIQREVAAYFNITVADLISEKRNKIFSYPRQIAIYLSKKLTTFPLKEIGRAFGNKHHSTIIYTIKRIENEKRQKREILYDIQMIEKVLASSEKSALSSTQSRTGEFFAKEYDR